MPRLFASQRSGIILAAQTGVARRHGNAPDFVLPPAPPSRLPQPSAESMPPESPSNTDLKAALPHIIAAPQEPARGKAALPASELMCSGCAACSGRRHVGDKQVLLEGSAKCDESRRFALSAILWPSKISSSWRADLVDLHERNLFIARDALKHGQPLRLLAALPWGCGDVSRSAWHRRPPDHAPDRVGNAVPARNRHRSRCPRISSPRFCAH